MPKFLIGLLFLSFFSTTLFSQKKTLQTQFTNEKIVIDGKFNEKSWQNADVAKDFIMFEPDNGKPESKERKTEVRIVYDNTAIYIAAKLFDNEPSKIRKELVGRDDYGTADHFGVFINGFNDGQQEYRFLVSASGVQMDLLYTETNGEDTSWNAIWDSKSEITDYGWAVEMKIPYAALRFSSEKKQTWGINFFREIVRDRNKYTWSRIDNKINNESTQEGVLNGIENITTPTRLFFIPYTSYYLNSNKAQTKGEFKAGMDIKYGINDAFTLDAVLVPDFGQTIFDKKELNLGPFEQQFSDNRPFFTEGTELFSKADLFYSRRIGGSPSTSATLNDNESFIKNPTTVNLLNALKISGRTKHGLGIGILNAITANTFAEIKDTISGATRKQLVEPLANYNVFVLDQRFRKNSSISFVNTNVTRNKEFRDANVSAAVFDLNTKKNTFKLNGGYKYSYVNDPLNLELKKGYTSYLSFGKTSGKYRTHIGADYYSKDWDPNDLGINYQTHYHDVYGSFGYRILQPTKSYNSFYSNINLYSEFDNYTGRIQAANISINFNTTDHKNDFYGYGVNGRPIQVSDFYEPRSDFQKKYVLLPQYITEWFYLSTNYNRKFALDFNPGITMINDKDRYNFNLMIQPRYRFNDHLSLVYTFQFTYQRNNKGWVAFDNDSNTIFARRNRHTIVNSLEGKYSINNVMNFNLAVRHYWSYAINTQFYTLQNDGSLLENTTYTDNQDRYYNSWNLDLSYSWWFAPGSQLSVLYRNNSYYNPEADFNQNYGQNFQKLFNPNILNNVLSVSLRYFIDYNIGKHWFSKN